MWAHTLFLRGNHCGNLLANTCSKAISRVLLWFLQTQRKPQASLSWVVPVIFLISTADAFFCPFPVMLQLLHLSSPMPANQAFMLAYMRNQFLQIHFGVLESYLILGFPSSSLNIQVKFVPFFYCTCLDLKTGGISKDSGAAACIIFFNLISVVFNICSFSNT